MGEPHACTHLGEIRVWQRSSSIAGCAACLAIGSWWVHLRMCMTCGTIGCCDSSPNHHASRHAREIAHPIARSVEPGEEWAWCYVDEVLLERSTIGGADVLSALRSAIRLPEPSEERMPT